MIGRFIDNVVILNKGYEINNFYENSYFKIDNNSIYLFVSAYVLKNKKVSKVINGKYSLDEFEKILITEENINIEKFVNEILYSDDKFIVLQVLDVDFECKLFPTRYSSFKEAENFFSNFVKKSNLMLVFNELFFNAYEHGNLALSFKEKEELIKKDKYFDFLKKEVNKKIEVCVEKKDKYVFVKITDEGEGFRLNQKRGVFNGMGIKMCEKFAYIFYNKKGNSVLFIGKDDGF